MDESIRSFKYKDIKKNRDKTLDLNAVIQHSIDPEPPKEEKKINTLPFYIGGAVAILALLIAMWVMNGPFYATVYENVQKMQFDFAKHITAQADADVFMKKELAIQKIINIQNWSNIIHKLGKVDREEVGDEFVYNWFYDSYNIVAQQIIINPASEFIVCCKEKKGGFTWAKTVMVFKLTDIGIGSIRLNLQVFMYGFRQYFNTSEDLKIFAEYLTHEFAKHLNGFAKYE